MTRGILQTLLWIMFCMEWMQPCIESVMCDGTACVKPIACSTPHILDWACQIKRERS